MNRQQFRQRINQERSAFDSLCEQEGVDDVAGYAYTFAPPFAESLILVLSEDEARNAIRADRPAAKAFFELVEHILDGNTSRDILAATIPPDRMTPFYAMCSLVLDAHQKDREALDAAGGDTRDLDAPNSRIL